MYLKDFALHSISRNTDFTNKGILAAMKNKCSKSWSGSYTTLATSKLRLQVKRNEPAEYQMNKTTIKMQFPWKYIHNPLNC